ARIVGIPAASRTTATGAVSSARMSVPLVLGSEPARNAQPPPAPTISKRTTMNTKRLNQDTGLPWWLHVLSPPTIQRPSVIIAFWGLERMGYRVIIPMVLGGCSQ